MKKHLFLLMTFVSFAISWKAWSAESTADDTKMIPTSTQENANTEDAPTSPTLMGSVLPRNPKRQIDQPNYPLFRPHAPQYYPPKTARTAILLSATLPGLGQTYAGRPGKGLAFLAAGIGLIAVGGFNLDRAVHYDDLAERFNTGFYDPHGDAFLTADQGRVKSRSHTQFGAIFLAAGIGVYIWNIFDAAKTVDQYNERRFPVQAQQNDGETYLTVSRHF